MSSSTQSFGRKDKAKAGPRAQSGQQTKSSEPLPDAIEFNQFSQTVFPPPTVIIHNMLEDSCRMILGGGSKSFKTWTLGNLALSVACGEPWWNFDTESLPVLYANFELRAQRVQSRFNAIAKARKFTVPKDKLFVWNLRNYHAEPVELVHAIEEYCQRYGIMLVIIDPFYQLLGTQRDERLSVDVFSVFQAFEVFNRKSAASTVTAAHFSKGNQADKDPIDRISGGATIHRHPDAILTMTQLKQDDAFRVDIVNRDFPRVQPFGVKWVHPLMVADSTLNPEDLKRTGRPTKYSVEDLVELLRTHDDEWTVAEFTQAVRDDTGMSASTFKYLWKVLKKSGRAYVNQNSRVNLKPGA